MGCGYASTCTSSELNRFWPISTSYMYSSTMESRLKRGLIVLVGVLIVTVVYIRPIVIPESQAGVTPRPRRRPSAIPDSPTNTAHPSPISTRAALNAGIDIGNSELSVILQKVETCLKSTNMLGYLRHKGLLNRTLADTEFYLKRIRDFIPSRFSRSLSNHCWKVDVKLKSDHSTHVISGQYGSQKYFIKKKLENEKLNSLVVRHGHYFDRNYNLPVACVPEFFIAGFPKCGSRYLYEQVTSHPSVITPMEKEPHWWVHQQYFTGDADYRKFHFVEYVVNYRRLVQQLLHTRGKSRLLSVDSSPSKMFLWPALSRGETDRHGVDYCLLPAVIPQILPRAKFIVVMRNPVDMLYSAFWYSCTHRGGDVPMEIQPKGPDIFHDRVLEKIESFNNCVTRNKRLPLAKCAITIAPNIFSSELHCGRSRLEMGLYYVHVQKWLSVVPRSKFLFLTLEELSADTNGVMANVWTFLDLPQVTSKPKKNKNLQVKVDYRHDPQLAMRNDTRKLLIEFFSPYNRMLADLLGDDKFLWDSPV